MHKYIWDILGRYCRAYTYANWISTRIRALTVAYACAFAICFPG